MTSRGRTATLHAGQWRFRFSTDPERWLAAWRPGAQVRMESRRSASPLLVELKSRGWIAPTRPPALLQASESEVRAVWRIGPLEVSDVYRGYPHGVERSVSVANLSSRELQLTGVRLTLPGLTLGRMRDCRLEAPATSLRPRLRAAEVIERRTDDPWSADLAPGARARWGRALEDAPDVTPGLLAIHNERRQATLLIWYHSEIEAAAPMAFGDGQRIGLGHHLRLAGWLPAGATLSGGTQYLAVVEGSWEEALRAFRLHYARVGLVPPRFGSPPSWVAASAVYEVHPGTFGGFDGLAARVSELRALGFDVLYLLPIMPYDNRSGRPWDENWLGSGSPYAIKDFEAFEPSLGGEAGFHRLMREADRVGMRVLLDFVPQGCALEARYVSEHPEWFCRDEAGNLVSSHGWIDTYSFDWANPAFQDYMLSWALRLARQHGISGYRIDAPHAKEPNWDRSIPYHASQTSLGVLPLLERLRSGLSAIGPDRAMLCELFGPLYARSHDFQCDYHPCVQLDALAGREISPQEIGEWLKDYWAVQPPGAVRLTFTETHDTRTQMHAYAGRGSAAERAMFAVLILAGFVPMVWSGQERGLEAWYRRVLRARAASSALLHGERFFNAVAASNPAALSILCRSEEETVWGLVSLHAERTPIRFSLAPALGPNGAGLHRLVDLIERRPWDEYGRMSWSGDSLRDVTLSPEPFVPYFFRIEREGAPPEAA